MNKTFRTLLDVEVYEVTGAELGELRATAKHDRFLERNILPEFCVDENGKVRRSESYLQWTDTGEEKYTLFNATTSDKLLGEELSNSGLEDLVKEFDFNYILLTFTKHKLKNRFLQIPPSEYLVIDLQYVGGGSFYNDDVDLLVNVIGKLNLSKIED
jgi:hypothetical protein